MHAFQSIPAPVPLSWLPALFNIPVPNQQSGSSRGNGSGHDDNERAPTRINKHFRDGALLRIRETHLFRPNIADRIPNVGHLRFGEGERKPVDLVINVIGKYRSSDARRDPKSERVKVTKWVTYATPIIGPVR